MTQEELWRKRYDEILKYVRKHHSRPSKYKPEDRGMHNWLKYNKKVMNKDKMPAERAEQFQELLKLLTKYRHINQYDLFVTESV